MAQSDDDDSSLSEKNSTSGLNETANASDNSTLNASSDSNSTTNATSNTTENEAHSVAYYYPYYRAARDPSAKMKGDEEEKKPYEPRPAKYKNNYEDPGFKVFKPVGFKPFIGTSAEKYIVADDSKEAKKKSPTESASEELQQ